MRVVTALPGGWMPIGHGAAPGCAGRWTGAWAWTRRGGSRPC